jgi:uncharacterized protein YdaU (DUF1376 family)
MAESVDIFFPFYVGDYLKKTQMLSCEEHGAYLLLIMALWQQKGGLPNNEKKLARICRLSKLEFDEVWSEIKNYFTINDGIISSKRVSEELEKAGKRKEIARENGLKGGRPKKPSGLPGGLPSGVPGDKPKHKAKPNPEESSSPSPSPSPLNTNTASPAFDIDAKRKRFAVPQPNEINNFAYDISSEYPGINHLIESQRFFDYYESNGWKVGKNKMKNWKAAFRGWLSRSSGQNKGNGQQGNLSFRQQDRLAKEQEDHNRQMEMRAQIIGYMQNGLSRIEIKKRLGSVAFIWYDPLVKKMSESKSTSDMRILAHLEPELYSSIESKENKQIGLEL